MLQDLKRRELTATLILCFLAAALEGVDLQSMGIAGAQLIREFNLSPSQFGNAASLSPAGLLVGALIGGWLADRVGRKVVLIGSVLAFGISSLLTTLVGSYDTLLVVRFAVGLGLGGAFPNLIALSSEVAGRGKKATVISLVYAGVPMGTIIGTLMVLHYGAAFRWRWIFYVGGFGPLVLAPLLMLWLPESKRFKAAVESVAGVRPKRKKSLSILFGEGRLITTLFLWTSFFFTLLIVYLMTNWLNQLMTGRGLDRNHSTTVLLAFGIGSVLGGVSLGALSDTSFRRWTSLCAYSGVAVCLVGLSRFTLYPLLLASGFGVGYFAVGSQLINYSLAPQFYPAGIRGTGVGWAVAIGRAGSIFGPLLAGLLLQRNVSASAVIVFFVPGLLIAALASTVLLSRPTVE